MITGLFNVIACINVSNELKIQQNKFSVLSNAVPPQNVTITPQRPMKEGVPIILTCDSGSSNPVSRITWSKNESVVLKSVEEIGHYDGQFGGRTTKSRLEYVRLQSY